jgi:hypothetical protein
LSLFGVWIPLRISIGGSMGLWIRWGHGDAITDRQWSVPQLRNRIRSWSGRRRPMLKWKGIK